MSPVPAILVAAWSIVVLGAALVAAWRRRAPGSSGPAPNAAIQVLLVRPCAGDEPGLEARLEALPRLPSHVRLRVLFVVAAAEDSAWPVTRRVATRLRARNIHADALVAPPIGPNRKASALHAAVRHAADDCDVVVNADSGVRLTGPSLDSLVTTLARGEEQLGAAWAPPAELGTTSHDASRAILGASLQAPPLLAGIDGGTMIGKLFAVRKDALEAAGGFAPLVRYLGEEVELSRRLRALGYAVRPIAQPAAVEIGPHTWRDTLARQRRWLQVLRAQRPHLFLLYPLFFFPTLWGLALLGVAGMGAPQASLASLATVIGTRLGVAVLATWRSGLPRLVGLDPRRLAIAEVTLAAAWLLAGTRRTVAWRGTTLRLDADGRLETSSAHAARP